MLFPNKLYKKGVAADGVIVKRSHGTYRDIRFGYYQVTTRLQLPDASTAERTDMLTANDDGEFNEGDMIPVRYDAKDHSKFVIDFPLIEAREKERQAQSEAATDSRVEAQLARANEPGAGASGPGVQSIPGSGGVEDLKSQLLQAASSGRASVVDLSGRSPSAQSGSDHVEQLAKLADLKDRGILTDAEFAAEKAKILGEN